MDLILRVNGKMDNSKDKEKKRGQMEVYMKANTVMAKGMVQESLLVHLDQFTKVSLRIIRNKDMGFKYGLMGNNMMDNMLMIK